MNCIRKTLEQLICQLSCHWSNNLEVEKIIPLFFGHHMWSLILIHSLQVVNISSELNPFLDGAPKSIGHEIKKHGITDRARFWTFVDQEEFTSSGIVDTIEFYAMKSGRPLNVGIFRSQSTKECDYKLVQQISLKNIKTGINKVKWWKTYFVFTTVWFLFNNWFHIV